MTVNHTNYDADMWNWCPNPQRYTDLKLVGLPILESIKQELISVIGDIPFRGGEFTQNDLAIALVIALNNVKGE